MVGLVPQGARAGKLAVPFINTCALNRTSGIAQMPGNPEEFIDLAG